MKGSKHSCSVLESGTGALCEPSGSCAAPQQLHGSAAERHPHRARVLATRPCSDDESVVAVLVGSLQLALKLLVWCVAEQDFRWQSSDIEFVPGYPLKRKD